MTKELVVLANSEPRAGTHIMSQGFQVEHRALRKLVIKYRREFDEMGDIAQRVQKHDSKEGGRPIEEFMLNEEQALYIITLLTNTDHVRKFKRRLIKEFLRVREMLAQEYLGRRDAEYLERREQGILIRKVETDVIKQFVDYATAQGSASAKMYYCNITMMQNRALFFLEQKYPNIRSVLNISQLFVITCADQIVTRWLKIGMEQQLPYKEIYKLCKEQVEIFAGTMGKTVVPGLLTAGAPALQLATAS